MIPTTKLTNNYEISRIIKGGWQLAGGHGPVNQKQAIADMFSFVDAGITTFDCADIYTGVEEMIGAFLAEYRKIYGTRAASSIKIHTKFVPDRKLLKVINSDYVQSIIERSIQRLGTKSLDLVQFHWWDFSVPGCIETAKHLDALRQQGLIKNLGVTNFDVSHLKELMSAGIPIVSNQVQFSLIDQRAKRELQAFCEQHRISLLCYGTLAGGFISERYLGVPEPHGQLENRSLVKYKLIIDDAGGWEKFQKVLTSLHEIALTLNTTVSTLASAYILQQKNVAAVIVGARNTEHLKEIEAIARLQLSPQITRKVEKALRQLPKLPGDVYEIERTDKRHAGIMKYNLNQK